MDRKHFLYLSAAMLAGSQIAGASSGSAPKLLHFKDDGVVPNSKHPLLLYSNVFSERDEAGAQWLERQFLANSWSNSWRNGIFTFQHYHSITHEALGIYSGEATVLLGGDKGIEVKVKAGDIIIIPAGVGHKNLGSKDLGVFGAYPNGMAVDLMRCLPGERPGTDKNIAAVPFPDTDPLMGKTEGLRKIWIS